MSDLDKAKQVTGSDAKTAQILGVSKSTLSQVRHGLRQLTPYQSAKLAEIIGERWHDAALARLAELAASEEERRFWQGKLLMLAGIVRAGALAVFLIIGGVFLLPTGNAEASNLSPSFHQPNYLLRTYRRRQTVAQQKQVFRGADWFRAICEILLAGFGGAWFGRRGLPSFGPHSTRSELCLALA